MPLLWKFLREGMESQYGTCVWKVGEWKKEDSVELCSTGFHASEHIYQAFSYVQGEVLARVEVRGESKKEDDKQAWTEMRIKKAYKWTKEESVKLAVFAAELVIDIYQKQYPNDDRPKKAIEAAKEYISDPSEKNRAAARAARAAAYAADAAADAARAAAYAARQELFKKIEKYLLSRVKELEEIK